MNENEEIRCGFKVSSNRKKIWKVQLWLLELIKEICEKNNIRYYADWWTLLWAIRHKWFIPWDDDIDIVMFRNDYEKFHEVAPKELPKYIKIHKYYSWFSKMENTNTASFWDDNRWSSNLIWWINLDIFPIDYASKYMIENWLKTVIILFLRAILLSQNSDRFIKRMKKWKQPFIYFCKFVFGKINWDKIYEIHEKIMKKVFFKWKNVFSAGFVYRYFPESIYKSSHMWEFEDTLINIPDWYDIYLKSAYWDYMKPVIYEWGHHRRYSTDKSYKDFIKTFDRSKSNEENYKNWKSLFTI